MKSMGGARASILRSHHLRWYRRKWHNALSGGFAHGLHVEGRCTTATATTTHGTQPSFGVCGIGGRRADTWKDEADRQPPKRSARCRHPRGRHATPRPSTITHSASRPTPTRPGRSTRPADTRGVRFANSVRCRRNPRKRNGVFLHVPTAVPIARPISRLQRSDLAF